jgi:hypothetical protein
MGMMIIPTTALTLAHTIAAPRHVHVVGLMLMTPHNPRILSLLRKLPREMEFPSV